MFVQQQQRHLTANMVEKTRKKTTTPVVSEELLAAIVEKKIRLRETHSAYTQKLCCIALKRKEKTSQKIHLFLFVVFDFSWR